MPKSEGFYRKECIALHKVTLLREEEGPVSRILHSADQKIPSRLVKCYILRAVLGGAETGVKSWFAWVRPLTSTSSFEACGFLFNTCRRMKSDPSLIRYTKIN